MSRLLLIGVVWVLTITSGLSVSVRADRQSSTQCTLTHDFGEWVYMTKPDAIMRAIRASEGVPSYGIMWLAEKYGGHEKVPQSVGRKHAGKLLHRIHRQWVSDGRPLPFLTYLRDTWAPLDADNDPADLNHNWLENVSLNLAFQLVHD